MSTIRKGQILIAMKFQTLKNTKLYSSKLNGFTVLWLTTYLTSSSNSLASVLFNVIQQIASKVTHTIFFSFSF